MKRLFLTLLCLFSFNFAYADPITGFLQTMSEKEHASYWVMENAVLPNRAKLSEHKARQYVEFTYSAANKYNLDPRLLLGMMHQESRFNEKARSGYGAVGLLQVVPRWHKARFTNHNYTDPEQNILAGASYLRELLDKTGSVQKAVRLYSGGATAYYAKITKHRSSFITYKKSRDIPPIYAQATPLGLQTPFARDQIGALLAMKGSQLYDN